LNNVPVSDIQEIKGQLRSISEKVSHLGENQKHLIHRMDTLDKTIDDKIELAIRRTLAHTDSTRREVSSWVIGMVAFGFMVLFGLIQVAVSLWT